MAERQAAHRQSLEKFALATDASRSKYGLILGFIVALVFLAGCVALVWHGDPIPGSILGVLDITGLVGIFVYGTESRKRERIEKANILKR